VEFLILKALYFAICLCLEVQNTSYAKLELFVIPGLCLWFQELKCDKRGIFLPLFQQRLEISICHRIQELGMLRPAKTELLFVS